MADHKVYPGAKCKFGNWDDVHMEYGLGQNTNLDDVAAQRFEHGGYAMNKTSVLATFYCPVARDKLGVVQGYKWQIDPLSDDNLSDFHEYSYHTKWHQPTEILVEDRTTTGSVRCRGIITSPTGQTSYGPWTGTWEKGQAECECIGPEEEEDPCMEIDRCRVTADGTFTGLNNLTIQPPPVSGDQLNEDASFSIQCNLPRESEKGGISKIHQYMVVE